MCARNTPLSVPFAIAIAPAPYPPEHPKKVKTPTFWEADRSHLKLVDIEMVE